MKKTGLPIEVTQALAEIAVAPRFKPLKQYLEQERDKAVENALYQNTLTEMFRGNAVTLVELCKLIDNAKSELDKSS